MSVSVRLGFEVPTARPVDIPLKHLVVTGQTQESGKTTTLEALLSRAVAAEHLTAVAFITKRGERPFRGNRPNRLQPFFNEQADWVFVSSLIDLTMGGKNKILHSFLMKVCRNTHSLQEVLRNVRAARDQARRGFDESIYQQILGYLELVVPQLHQLPPFRTLRLEPGINVMDLSPYSVELQALCIRSVLDHVNVHAERTVVVIPEAWEFIPEGKGSPVKAAAERLIRKGAALGNQLWVDSQDLAGVWKTVVRSCAVALIGVQREANEIKRTLANIPAGLGKPTAADVARLGLGQFYACWKAHVVKTYVQPVWMSEGLAINVAKGVMSAETSAGIEALKHVDEEDDVARVNELEAQIQKLQDEVTTLRAENAVLREAAGVDRPRVSERGPDDPTRRAPLAAGGTSAAGSTLSPLGDIAALTAAVKAELLKDPKLLKVALAVPELEVQVTRHTVQADGTSSLGLVARLLQQGFFDARPVTATAAWNQMKRYGFAGASARVYEACDKLVLMGFLTKETDGYQVVEAMKRSIKGAA